MNIILKIALYIILAGATGLSAWKGYQESRSAFSQTDKYDSELTAVPGEDRPAEPVAPTATGTNSTASSGSANVTGAGDAPGDPSGTAAPGSQSRMITWFMTAAVLFLITAFLVARDVASYTAEKTVEFVYNTEGSVSKSEEYEAAEAAWTAGNYIDAIEMLKRYYRENPRDVFAARRIAEIYEKDLENYSAAAMEYEEMLKLDLPPVRWGWMAIHLCNIYSGKLNNSERALELLQQIVMEHTDTPPGRKARERLEKLGFEIEIVEDDQDGDGQSPMPRGFRPRA